MSSGRFKLSKKNNDVFTNSYTNDLILQADNDSQRILIGMGCNVEPTIIMNNNIVTFSNMIGIGTTMPIEVLDVRGSVSISDNQYILGNVGIGTNNTQGKNLYIKGDVQSTGEIKASNLYITGDMTVLGTQTILDTDVAVTDQFIVNNTGSDTALIVKQSGQQNTVEAYYNDKISFIVGDNGNVGISTLTPTENFEVYGDSLLNGHTTVNCNLNVTKITNLSSTVNCLSDINIIGDAKYSQNIIIDGVINCHSNINVTSNLYCPIINNITLNYDVPNVVINDTSINARYIQFTLSNVKQDNDGFGNLIPHIDKLYLTYYNPTLGSSTFCASNNIQNIKYINIFTESNNLNYTTTNSIEDTLNLYGLVTTSNYTFTLYYQNYRGNSPNNTIISNLATLSMGPPSTVQNITFTSNNNHLYINFNIPSYTDSINNQNICPIKSYYMNYSVLSSMRFSNLSHSKSYTSSNNSFTISNYKNELYPGTTYNFQIYSKNQNIDTNSAIASNYLFTGFDSNDFTLGSNLTSIKFLDQNNNFYDYNTYYSIDCGSNSPVTYITCSSSNYTRLMYNNSSFYKYSSTSNLRLFYTPNPNYSSTNSTNVAYITSKLDIVTKNNTENLETLNYNILPFNSNTIDSYNNNKYLSINLTNLNSNSSDNRLDNYFLNSGINILNNYNIKTSNCSYNKYNLYTSATIKEYKWLFSNITISEFPPSSMTSSISTLSDGLEYIVTSSSSYGSTYSNYKAFDKNTTTSFLSAPVAGKTYLTTTGKYESNYKYTIIDNVEYNGEWIQIQLPYSIILSYFTIRPGDVNTYNPNIFILVASNDGINWISLINKTIDNYSNTDNPFYNTTNFNSYKYFRLCVSKVIGGSATAGYAWFNIRELKLFGFEENSLQITNSNLTSTSYSNLLLYSNLYTEIDNGNVNFEYFYDNIKDIGEPSLSNFKYSYTPNNKKYVSGILSASNYSLTYNVTLSNAASYWTINPIIKVKTNNSQFSNIYREITTSNNYYYYNNNVPTEIDKNLLDTGLVPYNYHLTFKETDTIIINSNVLYSNLDISLTGYNLIGNTNSNVTVGLFNYDSNSLNHPHITNNTSSYTYGQRVFVDFASINSNPSLSTISTYNHNCNMMYYNYSNEAVLFNGLYYGNWSDTWKKNWTLIDSSSCNYSTITSNNVRWCTTLFTNIMGSSTNLQININSNSHDDKLLYVKYKSSDLSYESPWFNASNSFNGKTLYNRTNNDGIRDITKTDTQYIKNIKSPPIDYMDMYISIGIPYSNLNSCFNAVYITSNL